MRVCVCWCVASWFSLLKLKLVVFNIMHSPDTKAFLFFFISFGLGLQFNKQKKMYDSVWNFWNFFLLASSSDSDHSNITDNNS